jgi:hypothetical protein
MIRNLIERLEAGETGRSIEMEIENSFRVAKFYQKHPGADFDMLRCDPPTYTTSLDAAIVLCEQVKPKWHWSLNSVGEAHFYLSALSSERHTATAPTPAAALLAALLRSVETGGD